MIETDGYDNYKEKNPKKKKNHGSWKNKRFRVAWHPFSSLPNHWMRTTLDSAINNIIYLKRLFSMEDSDDIWIEKQDPKTGEWKIYDDWNNCQKKNK
jgi:hypothetical protein